MKIFIPTQSFQEWQRLLAKPDLHWKEGHSAMTLARSWEAAAATGFPPEIKAALQATGSPFLADLDPLLALPEFQVPLPGGVRSSQADLLVLARGKEGVVAIVVEGKVDETFGPSLREKKAEHSDGFKERQVFLLQYLELPPSIPQTIRYQLLHRTAAALIVARQFDVKAAVMLVHSFSPTNKGFSDFEAFAGLFNTAPEVGKIISAGTFEDMPLFLGWCVGDQRFRFGGQPAEP
jgi:hypothetical protein